MIRVEHGDALEVLPRLVAEGVVVDSVVCDPPYGLEFMGKEWDKLDGGLPQENVWKGRRGKGGSSIGNDDSRPGSRHHVAYGVKRAGFKRCVKCGKREFSGSPCTCAEPEWNLEFPDGPPSTAIRMQRWHESWARAVYGILRPGGYLLSFGGTRTHHRLWCAIEDAGFVIQDCILWLYSQGFPKGKDQLKPAWEPICVAYKPGGKRTLQVDECRVLVSDEWLAKQKEWHSKYGNRDYAPGSILGINNGAAHRRLSPPNEHGRWPANVCLSDDAEVMEAFAAFGEKSSGALKAGTQRAESSRQGNCYGRFPGNEALQDFGGDSGSAARFFYCAKADAEDRFGSRHPTVKPVEILKWLVPLVTPKGGLCLDCFSGSGTTGVAALATGRHCILIEREAEYVSDIHARLAFYRGEGRHSIVSKNRNRSEVRGSLL